MAAQAANSLIYPMDWQHIYIPILPRHLADYLAAPMPFLIGVPAPIMAESVKQHELSEVVVLDADEQASLSLDFVIFDNFITNTKT